MSVLGFPVGAAPQEGLPGRWRARPWARRQAGHVWWSRSSTGGWLDYVSSKS